LACTPLRPVVKIAPIPGPLGHMPPLRYIDHCIALAV
jgi:hypothetical protein